MARSTEITVNVGISVTKETAERCLEILSMYLTDNPLVDIETHTFEHEDGDRIMRRVYLTEAQAQKGHAWDDNTGTPGKV